MSKNVYQWQGEKAKVRFGRYKVEEQKDKPLYWYNYEVLALQDPYINCVEVTSQGQTFYIYNGFGYGVAKLEAGGWPNMGHMSLPSDKSNFTEYTPEEWATVKFKCLNEDMQKFEAMRYARDTWFRQQYPEEMKKMDALRALAPKIK